ncbi:MAG: hypothetical protein LBI42_01160 [Chitinispirillales bacterium]|nr:hypothetical protein [Chitinispirillales bacterium]
MNKNAKKIGRFKRLGLRLIGPALSKMVLSWFLSKKIDKSKLALPADINRSSNIFIILPQERTEMIFQLENLFSMLGKYRDSKVTFLCPAAHVSFVIGLKNATVIKYIPQELALYNEPFYQTRKEISRCAFDICINLEKRYNICLAYFCALSRAHLRMGWEEAGTYPFLNVRLKPASGGGSNLWERNTVFAKLLGAYTDSKVRWGVPKAATEEVAQLLAKHKLKREPALICVDLANLEKRFGKPWCGELIRELKKSGAGQFYIFGGLEGESVSFTEEPFPCLPPLSITRTAALIAVTDFVITGKGALLGLSQVSYCKIIPVVNSEQAALYCKSSNRISPALFSEKPDSSTVRLVLKNLRTLISLNKSSASGQPEIV